MSEYSIHTHHIFFIHSAIDRHMGCFHTTAIVNNAAVHIGVHVYFWIFFSDIYPGVELLGHINLIYFFEEPLFSTVPVSIHSHKQCIRAPFSPHIYQHLIFVFFLMIAILTGVKWYLMVIFKFMFLWLLLILSIFSCACWPSAFQLWKNVCFPLPLF